jgi:hypothetical protein
MLRFATGFVLLAAGCSSAAADASATVGELRASKLDARFFDPDVADDDVFTHADPDPATMDVATIEKMLADAQASGSESAIVAVGDTIVAEKYFGHDGHVTSVQSVTKSVTSLLSSPARDRGRLTRSSGDDRFASSVTARPMTS